MSFLDDYEPVVERLAKFWAEYPSGRVWTELVLAGTDPGQLVVFRAAVYKALLDEEPCATGFAHQRMLGEPPAGKYGKPNLSAPEWTSPYEVCETSAIGRALANAGYDTKGKRASREEMGKAESANELFDVNPWLEALNEAQLQLLREWWKTEGPGKYQAAAVPGTWLQPIRERIDKVMSGERSGSADVPDRSTQTQDSAGVG